PHAPALALVLAGERVDGVEDVHEDVAIGVGPHRVESTYYRPGDVRASTVDRVGSAGPRAVGGGDLPLRRIPVAAGRRHDRGARSAASARAGGARSGRWLHGGGPPCDRRRARTR